MHLVAAYLPTVGVVLAQLTMADKENEVVVPALLVQVDLAGMMVMGDVMQTQRDLRIQVVEAGGDYLWFVKDKQPTLRDDLELLFAPEVAGVGCAGLAHGLHHCPAGREGARAD